MLKVPENLDTDKNVVYSEEECACLCRSGDNEILRSDQISFLQIKF